VPGFLGNTDDFYESSDAEGGAWRELVALWWERSKDAPLRVADVNALCAERELFEDLRGDGTERSQQTKLGKALQASRDRVFGGFRIQLVRDDKHKGRSYVLVPVGEEGERAMRANGERVDDAESGPGTVEGEVDPWAA
jgi:hypothetical protein